MIGEQTIEQLIQYLEKQGHKFTATLNGLTIEPEPTGDDLTLYREYYWHIYRHFFRGMVHEMAQKSIHRLKELLQLYPDQREQFSERARGIVGLGATTDHTEIEIFYDRVVEFIDAVTMLEEYHESRGHRADGEVH